MKATFDPLLADTENGARLTRTIFAMVPAGLIQATARKKGHAFVYMNLLLHDETTNQEDTPILVASLANRCGMTIQYVREALSWLHENGWITRFSRPGAASLYYVHSEQQPRQEEAA